MQLAERMSRLGTESAFEVLASRQALGAIVDCAIARRGRADHAAGERLRRRGRAGRGKRILAILF